MIDRPSPTDRRISPLGMIVLALSVAYLVWTVGSLVGPAFAPGGIPGGPVSEFEIHANHAKDEQIRLDCVLVDGSQLREANVATYGGWTREKTHLFSVIWHDAGADPAPAVVRGRNLVIRGRCAPGSGEVVIRKRGSSLPPLHCSLDGGWEDRPHWAWPQRSPPVWFALLSALGIVGLAYWFGPWRRGRSVWPWYWFHTLTAHGAYFAAFQLGATTDTTSYLIQAQDPFAGYPQYFPPGYPLFLSLFGDLPAAAMGHAVGLTQHLLVTLGAGAVLALALRAGLPRAVALLGALTGVSLLATQSAGQGVMSDFVGLVTVAIPLWILARFRNSRWIGPVLAGLLCGAGGLARVMPIPALGVSLAFAVIGRQAPVRLRASVLALCVAALCVAGFVGYHGVSSGSFQLTSSTWKHLFNHFIHSQKLLDSEGPATRAMAELVGEDLRELPHWHVAEKLRAAGVSWDVVHRGFELVTKEAIQTASWSEHLSYSLDLTWENLTTDPELSTAWLVATPDYVPELESPALLGVSRTGLDWRFVHSEIQLEGWFYLVVTGLIGAGVALLFGPRRRLALALVAAPMAYVFCSSAVEYRLPRYSLPTGVFFAQLAFWPLAVPSIVWGWLRAVRGSGANADAVEDESNDPGAAGAEERIPTP